MMIILFKDGWKINPVFFHIAGSGKNTGGSSYLLFRVSCYIAMVRRECRKNQLGRNKQ